MGYAFQADSRQHFVAPVFQSVVALRIELSAARLSAEHGQPALDDLLGESGTSGSNRKPPGPKPGVLPTAPLPDVVVFIQSERSDLNRRSPVPRTGAITRLRYVLIAVARMGIEPISPP